uniref:Uncharacterized protein n=1 Tax=Rangifer tarandus platyrhynchus TaxID=3082113 RepID=A0ACB0FAS4_RANTA|nr:unnamed protein product [Rangifer tarandus platyrhynchus]
MHTGQRLAQQMSEPPLGCDHMWRFTNPFSSPCGFQGIEAKAPCLDQEHVGSTKRYLTENISGGFPGNAVVKTLRFYYSGSGSIPIRENYDPACHEVRSNNNNISILKALPSCLEVVTRPSHTKYFVKFRCTTQSEKAEGQGRNGRGAEDKMNYFLQGPDDWEESVAQKGETRTGLQAAHQAGSTSIRTPTAPLRWSALLFTLFREVSGAPVSTVGCSASAGSSSASTSSWRCSSVSPHPPATLAQQAVHSDSVEEQGSLGLQLGGYQTLGQLGHVKRPLTGESVLQI